LGPSHFITLPEALGSVRSVRSGRLDGAGVLCKLEGMLEPSPYLETVHVRFI